MQNGKRRPREVFEDHLRLANEGNFKEDLRRNYAADVVVLTGFGVFRGHAGMQTCTRQLQRELPAAHFAYPTQVVEGDVAFLEWTAATAATQVQDGADSSVIREGRIMAQTIHSTVQARGGADE